jgi:hypothetical protein
MPSQLDSSFNADRCVSSVAEVASVNPVALSGGDYRHSTVLALVLCGLFTIAGLLYPPSLSHDAGWGMQEWRTLAAGGPFNNTVSPDPADISRDQASFVTWWSPGQYLIPGVLTLLGLRLGTALTVTAGACLLCSLIGWVRVAKYFALSPVTAMLLVAFIATFRYSTVPFGIYNGGEILLQGLTPWLILAGCQIPFLSAVRAAALACLAVWIAFFAKLTGVMVASAALLVGAVAVLVRLRRITAGMAAGAVGATFAFGVLHVAWFSRGTTPASGTGWSFDFGKLFFALATPWGAGISWGDLLAALLRRSSLDQPIDEGHLPSVFLWCLLPPVVLFLAVILKGWRENSNDSNLNQLIVITVGFYLVCALAMAAIFLHGGDVSLEERHLRASGTLIFLCVMAIISRMPRNSVVRLTVLALCGLMSLYGCFGFAHTARSTKRTEVDPYSRTHQAAVDESAIEFARTAFAREGRAALFVLPSPDAACAFPPSARILTNHIEFEPDATIAARTYRGKVRGPLYVIMSKRVAESAKGTLLLKEFVDYPFDGWASHSFGSSTVFVQGQTEARN